jgi:steroid 5-alpha reductase family enzyme
MTSYFIVLVVYILAFSAGLLIFKLSSDMHVLISTLLKGVSFSVIDILFIIAIVIWGIRLTLNWAIRWKGLQHQDWRYTMLREKSPRLWFFTNLFGINLMPTVIVFIALTPVYFGIGQERPLNFYISIWFAICMGAVLVQTISDRQMDLFKKTGQIKTNILIKDYGGTHVIPII